MTGRRFVVLTAAGAAGLVLVRRAFRERSTPPTSTPSYPDPFSAEGAVPEELVLHEGTHPHGTDILHGSDPAGSDLPGSDPAGEDPGHR